MTTSPIVHVVDDDEAIRDSLRWLLEGRKLRVRTYPSAEEFLRDCDPRQPGCAILDVRMPGISGLELHERLTAQGWALPVIFITGHGDVPMAVGALKKGAVDFIEKPINNRELLLMVEQCLDADADARDRAAQAAENASRLASLSPRERQVMELVVAGKLNKQIADDLQISIKTVEMHRAKIMEKTQVGSVADLVRLALNAASTR